MSEQNKMTLQEQGYHARLKALLDLYELGGAKDRQTALSELEILSLEAGNYFSDERGRIRDIWTEKQNSFVAATTETVMKISRLK
jgi:hypothetical protein